MRWIDQGSRRSGVTRAAARPRACITALGAQVKHTDGFASNPSAIGTWGLNEGQGVASQMLDKELGVTRDAFCKCGAPVAKSSLSSDGYRAMILEMQGKREEARTMRSVEEQRSSAFTTPARRLDS